MKLTVLGWIARFALASALVLIVAGATVRATGSGLGCPDWPTCWGCLIPPWNKEQIDPAKLDLERFRASAARHGIDPTTITDQSVLSQFNPVHTWVEFCNRLTSLPLGVAVLALFVMSFRARQNRWLMVVLATASLANVLYNAWLGAEVVRSGLEPGIITLHMALAFLLISLLATAVWATRPGDKRFCVNGGKARLAVVSALFFLCLFAEGILGSQVREQTDVLAQSAGAVSRKQWIEALSGTKVYLVHRSLSWLLLALAGLMFFWVKKYEKAKALGPRFIFAAVCAMMVMGLVMAHWGVFRVVQVLHVSLTAALVAATWIWLMDLLASREQG